MKRREIVELFQQMGLTYYHSKHSKNQRWKIPNETSTIRIVLSDDHMVHNHSIANRWSLDIRDNVNKRKIYTLSEGIKLIQDKIHKQFEKQFAKSEMTGYWAHMSSSYAILDFSEPKIKHQSKPTQNVCKTQRYKNKPRFNRLSYPGRR